MPPLRQTKSQQTKLKSGDKAFDRSVNKTAKLNKPTPEIMFDRTWLDDTIQKLSKQIRVDYTGKQPLFIPVLTGAFVFASDLIRQLEDIPLDIDFAKISSYGITQRSSGLIQWDLKPQKEIAGRDVIIIEDIVDTGLTAKAILDWVGEHNPASLKLCSLFSKPSRRKLDVKIDYLGTEIPDKFVVGYGMDYQGKCRNWNSVWYYPPE